MLNLDVCDRCMKRRLPWAVNLDRGIVNHFKQFACPGKDGFGSKIAKLYEPPPKWCEYKLEHGVSAARGISDVE
jgi:hypothetical protein